MANVMFKRGTQADLKKLSSYVDGAFYLTTDTDRLYVAQSSSDLVELNKSITVVNTLSDLPTSNVEVGQFYYVKTTAPSGSDKENTYGGNILVVCTAVTSGTPTWTQVNPDTDTKDDHNTYATALTAVKRTTGTGASDETKLVYDITLTQKDHDLVAGGESSHADVVGTLTISSSDIAGVTVSVSIGIAGTLATGGGDYAIALSGTGADTTTSVHLHKGNNINFASADDGITISAVDSKGTLSSSGAVITYKNDGSEVAGTVTFEGDGGAISVAGDGNNKIKYSHNTSGVTAGSYGQASNATLSYGGTLTVPKVTVDANGHVTAASDITLTMPTDNNTKVNSVSAGNDGKISIVTSNDGTKTSGADLYINYDRYGADGNKIETKKVLNQGNLGDFYDKAAIDGIMKGLDALVYKGSVGGTGATVADLPESNVCIGDTYKVGANGTYASKACKVGDLLIATGTEGDDGYITSATLGWSFISSAADTDTTYTLSAGSDKITLTPSTGGAQNISISDDDKVVATVTTNSIAFSHANVGAGSAVSATSETPTAVSPIAGGKVTVVSGVKADTTGHIASVDLTEVTLPADRDSQYALGSAANSTKITLTGSGTADGQSGNVELLAGTNMSLSGTEVGKITFNHDAVSHTTETVDGTTNVGYDSTFTTLSAVETDTQGHITKLTNKTFKLPASVDTLYAVKGSASVDSNVAKLTSTLTPSGSAGNSASSAVFGIATSTLKIASGTAGTGEDARISIDLEWGSFN